MSEGRLVIKVRKIHDLLGNYLTDKTPRRFPAMESGLRHRQPRLPLPPHLSWSEANPGRHPALSAPSQDIDITFPGAHLLQQTPTCPLTFSSLTIQSPLSSWIALLLGLEHPPPQLVPAMRPCPASPSCKSDGFLGATPQLLLPSPHDQETPLSVPHTWALASPHCMPKPVTDVDTVRFWPPLSESNSANECQLPLHPYR